MSIIPANYTSKSKTTIRDASNISDKQAQRIYLKEKRKEIFAYYQQNSKILQHKIYYSMIFDILKIIKDKKICTIAGYWPIATELDVKPILEYLYSAGYEIGLPIVLGPGKPLIFREWTPETELIKNGFCYEPPSSSPRVNPDMLLVPLLGFNSKFYRLGYGQGFYDRTIQEIKEKRSIITIGLGFDIQFYEDIQYNPDEDQKLDHIVTENGIFTQTLQYL